MEFEHRKFAAESAEFHRAIDEILELDIPKKDLIHQYPIYSGFVNLGHHLALYELFKKTLTLSGHVAEIGTWKGAGLLFFAKLIKLFEPHSNTQVHGFDWFEGMDPDPEMDALTHQGMYKAEYELLLELIRIQKLENIAFVHKLDVAKEITKFFEEFPSLRFKLIYLDCGIYAVVKKSIQAFWPRLVKGGILIFDHFNNSAVPQECRAIQEELGDVEMHQIEFCRRPTGYVVKA